MANVGLRVISHFDGVNCEFLRVGFGVALSLSALCEQRGHSKAECHWKMRFPVILSSS